MSMLNDPAFSDPCKEAVRQMGRMYDQLRAAMSKLESSRAEMYATDATDLLAVLVRQAKHEAEG